MDFEHDVFISYAHLDNESLLEGQKGWVSNFHRMLEVCLSHLLGKKSRLWRDPKLQGNDYLDDTILHRLRRAATLVSILSPRYVQSEWCRRELSEFHRLSDQTGGVRIDDRCRVFKVVMTPCKPHPDEILSLPGYDFFKVDSETGRPREIYPTYRGEVEPEFLTRINDLAYDIRELLSRLDHGGPQPSSPALPATRATVYLAETSFDLLEEREAVRRDLQHSGYTVLPGRPLPLVGSEIEAFVAGELARSTLSVHLVGKHYEPIPGSDESVLALQDRLATERSREAGLERLVWLPQGLTVEDERQKRFIERLRTDPALLDEKPLQGLKQEIHRKLTHKAEPERRTTQSGLQRIYLIFDPRDEPAAAPLGDYLFDRGFEVLKPLFDGDEEEVRQEHEENLCDCDAVLLYYGAVGELWQRRKLRELQRVPALGRTTPLLARGIYVAPPSTKDKTQLRTREALVLREPATGFTPEVLAPFLEQLASRPTRQAS